MQQYTAVVYSTAVVLVASCLLTFISPKRSFPLPGSKQQAASSRVGIYSHFWLLLHEYTLLYMYTYMYIDIQRIQYTDSMAPSFVKFCQVYHAFARTHTSVYFRPILLLLVHVYPTGTPHARFGVPVQLYYL